MANDGQFYDSDSDMWLGQELKQLSKRCKRISRNGKKLNSRNENTNELQQKFDSNHERGAIKVKPRTSPRTFKPEALPRKNFRHDASPVTTPDVRDASPTKTPNHNQHRYICLILYACI